MIRRSRVPLLLLIFFLSGPFVLAQAPAVTSVGDRSVIYAKAERYQPLPENIDQESADRSFRSKALLGFIARNEASVGEKRYLIVAPGNAPWSALWQRPNPLPDLTVGAMGGGTVSEEPVGRTGGQFLYDYVIYDLALDPGGELAIGIETPKPVTLSIWQKNAWTAYLENRRVFWAAISGGLGLLVLFLAVRGLVLKERFSASAALAVLFGLPFLSCLLLGSEAASVLFGPAPIGSGEGGFDTRNAFLTSAQAVSLFGLGWLGVRLTWSLKVRAVWAFFAITMLAALGGGTFAWIAPGGAALVVRFLSMAMFLGGVFALWRLSRTARHVVRLLAPAMGVFGVVLLFGVASLKGVWLGPFLAAPALAASLSAALALLGLGVAFAEDVSDEQSEAVPHREKSQLSERAEESWIFRSDSDLVEVAPWIERLALMPEGSFQGPLRFWTACLMPADRARFLELLKDVSGGRASTAAVYVRLQRSDGAQVPLLMRFRSCSKEGGDAVTAQVEDLGALGILESFEEPVADRRLNAPAAPAFVFETLKRTMTKGGAKRPVLMALGTRKGEVEGKLVRSVMARLPREALAMHLPGNEGERLLLAFPDGMESSVAHDMAKTLRQGIAADEGLEGIAIGIVESETGQEPVLDLVAETEHALRCAWAKEQRLVWVNGTGMGRDTSLPSVAYAGALRRSLGLDVENEDEDPAVMNAPLELSFLPIMSLTEHRFAGVEALPVWMATPGRLFGHRELADFAAEEGLAEELVGHLLVHGLAAQGTFKDAGASPFLFALNLPHPQEWRPGLAAWLRSAVEANELDPAEVLLGMPAQMLAHGGRARLEEIGTLQPARCSLMLTQVSAPLELDALTLPGLAAIRLDASLVRALPDPAALKTVRILFRAASEAGLQIAADGLDEVEQIDLLGSLGVALATGAAVGVPMTASSVRKTWSFIA